MIVEVTDANFENEVMKNAKPIVLDFWAPGCGPCKMIEPIIDSLSEEYKEQVSVWKVNLHDHSELAMKFGVRSIPTILYIKNGEVVHKHVGASSKKVFEDKLKDHLLS